MNIRTNVLSNIDVLVVVLAIAGWVILISDNPLSIQVSIITGLAAGFVYYFAKTKEKRVLKIPVISSFISTILIIVLFFAFIFTIFTQKTNLIAYNWYSINPNDWIRLFAINVFLTFMPGFIILKLVDRESKISTMPRVVLSILLSIFLSSQLMFIAKQISLDAFSSSSLFFSVNLVLVILFLRLNLKKQTPSAQKYKEINVNLLLAITFLIIFSAILVYLQQFVYESFVRGDNWNYLATSNYIDKGSSSLIPVGKFYSIKSLSIYELYSLGLFRLSGFPSVNTMMITSVVIASLIPIAFFAMSLQYLKSKKISLVSTLIYVAFSGFGWIPFIGQKISLSIQQYAPADLFAILNGVAPQVLNDISQPQGSIPEGFKTYVLALLSIMMLLYLFKSQLPMKSRMFLIAVISAFAFLAHIETTLAFFFAFLPAYVLLSRKRLLEIRTNIIALVLGVLLTLAIGLTSPVFLIVPFELNYILVAFALVSILLFTYFREFLRSKLPHVNTNFGSLKTLVLLLVCYLYLFSIIVLVSYGYTHMYYGDSVVYLGYAFPWYYYPLSFGIAGTLSLAGLFMKFEKHKSLSFFAFIALLTVILGIAVSYLNLNYFNTGTKEWRIIYRILPIATSVFGGWVLFRLMSILKNTNLNIIYRRHRIENYHQISLRKLSLVLFLVVIILGVPSTIISSEYWMSSNQTPFGPAFATLENLELANFVNQNVPITSRVATEGEMANAIIKLAGGTTAIPSIYPDFLSSSRPETISLLSSDISLICLDKEIAEPSINRNFISFLPKVFDNARFSVYSLPYLESPSESSFGYLAPLQYNNDTLLSYLILSSLNSSYELVNDDFHDKSTIIAPSDLSINKTSSYNVTSSSLLEWVDDGGTLIVMGGQGAIFESSGMFFGGINYKSNVTANSIRTNFAPYPIKTVNVKPFAYRIDASINVLSYYSINGVNVSPFVVEKKAGNGTILYIYLDPIYLAVEKGKNGWTFDSSIISIFRNTLEENGIILPKAYEGLSREPLENRWIGKYESYGTTEFIAEGNITLNAIASGSYILPYPIKAEKMILDTDRGLTLLENTTIKAVSIEGSANIKVSSDLCNLTSEDANNPPTYVSLNYENSSLKISTSNESTIRINTVNGNYSITDGSIIIESNSSELVLLKPQIIVNGTITFPQISLPLDSSAWTYDVKLVGNSNFKIDYSDGKYFFTDHITGQYNSVVESEPIIDRVPLKEIALSIPNIFLILSIIFLAASVFKGIRINVIYHKRID